MAVTLGELKARALDYADMTGSGFAVDARVTDYINAGLSELHDMLVASFEDYYLKTQTINLVSGTEAYQLPSDYAKTVKMWYVTGGRRFKVERFDLDNIDGYRDGPLSSGTIEHWYIPQMTKVENDNDPIEVAVHFGWEDFVALHAAVRLLIREESDHTSLAAEREAQRTRILNMAEPRDTGDPDQIGDYYDRWDGGRHLLRFDERYFKYRIMGNNARFVEVEYLGI